VAVFRAAGELMGQSNLMFGALLALFVVYITARGELRTYMGFIL
jgi:hypothetical protein